MVSERMRAVLARLDREDAQRRTADWPRAAVASAASVLAVDGITAGFGTGPEGVVVGWGTEQVGVALENLQFTLGQGPGVDVDRAGIPVLVPDLADVQARWPAFVPAAAEIGVRAVFAFPLRIGAINVGTLLAHRRSPGALGAERIVDALALADAVTVVLLHQQSAGLPGSPGYDSASADDRPAPGWAQPVTYRAEVHQATGMISVQLGVGLAEALARLRAYAWSHGFLIAEVAAEVVARRMRFDDTNL
jgi:hypothetical protein